MKEDKILFTIDDIKELATSSSYDRGVRYFYSGEVGEIVRDGSFFEGVVYGSRKYKVSLDISNQELNFRCSCPYDFEGICKHKVAFALKILVNDYKESNSSKQQIIKKKEFNTCFDKAKTKKKLSFLKQLLDRDTDLQQQFLEFTKDISEKLDNIIGEKIDITRYKIHNDLSSLDFDNIDNEDTYEYDNWGDDWGDDGIYDHARDMIEEVYTNYTKQVKNYLKKGNFLDAIRIVLGIYEGSQNLPELDNEDYYLFEGDYNSSVQNTLKEVMNTIASTMERIVKSDEIVMQLIDLVFDRISFCEVESDTADEKDNGIFYNIRDYEKIFQSLVINKTTAEYLYKYLQKNKLENFYSSFIILNIAEILDDETLWINTAESFSKNSHKITKLLLEKYKSKKMEKDFNRIAKMAFRNWANDFDFYLINNLNKEQEKRLYVDTLKNYVKNKHKIKQYYILRDYLTDKEKIDFVDDFKRGYCTIFYVQLLEIEERYKEILDCVQKHTNSNELSKLILPIINIYPNECFSIIIKINNKAINSSYGRKRQTYQTMVKTLVLLKQITSKKEEAILFLNELYNHKPNLPALKDEMRKAGLV